MNFVEFTELVIHQAPNTKMINVLEVKRRIVPEKVISLAPAQVPSKIQSPIPKIGTLISLPGKDVLVADTVEEVTAMLTKEHEENDIRIHNEGRESLVVSKVMRDKQILDVVLKAKESNGPSIRNQNNEIA